MSKTEALLWVGLSLCLVSYAIFLICGPSLVALGWAGVFLLLIGVCVWADPWLGDGFLDGVREFVVQPTITSYNLLWLLALVMICGVIYLQQYKQLTHLPYYPHRASGRSSGAELALYVYRFGFFMYWMLTESPWRWLCYAALLAITVLCGKGHAELAGWALLGTQVALGTLMRFHDALMRDFVIYYQSLMSVKPIVQP